MKRWIVLGLFCIAGTASAYPDRFCIPGFTDPLSMICNRVDPGNSKEGSGAVKYFDCITECIDTIPQVTCSQCSWARPDWAISCSGCSIQYPPSATQGMHWNPSGR